MNPNQEAQFQAILGRSRSLMQMVESANPSTPRGRSGASQQHVGGYSNENQVSIGRLGEVELDYDGDGMPDKQYVDANHLPIDSQSFSRPYNPETSDLAVNPEMAQYAMQNSALAPIFKSIADNPANPTSEDYNGSVLDRIGVPKAAPKTRRPVTENVHYQQVAPANIDYSLIKTIVAEQVAEIKKSLLTESAQTKQFDNVVALTVGKDKTSFRMVTAEGKIYNISMEYVGDMKKD